MRSQFSLLDGAPVSVDAPGAQLDPPIAVGVLFADTLEIEVNAGTPEAADLFLGITGTELTSQLQLRGGRTLRLGPLGGQRGEGWGYVVEVGDQRLFGPTPPALSAERLAAVLSELSPARNQRGLTVSPAGDVGWSPYRTQGASQVLTPASGHPLLLDIRRPVPDQRAGRRGAKVRGGLLSRQGGPGRQHVVLESEDFVTYGVPMPQTSLDELTEVMAEVLVELA
ncbi:MAG TPA: hypothetical protein GXZ45_01495 [Propionibacterium sp.]|nr:hypothetical protein [Propionibacterium sp.]